MANRYLLGFDVGSSSVKASLVNADSGKCVATAFFPEKEAPITAVKAGWAEQDPQMWWDNAKLSLKKIMAEAGATGEEIKAIVSPIRCMVWYVWTRTSRRCVRQSSGATHVQCPTVKKPSRNWVVNCA